MIEAKEVSELHDKIIAATARLLDVPLITKDALLRNIDNLKIIW